MNTSAMPFDPSADRPPAYRSYLLRFWEERSEQPAAPVWRFSLEDPQSTNRLGFASLSALSTWIQSEIDGLSAVAGPGAKDPPAG